MPRIPNILLSQGRTAVLIHPMKTLRISGYTPAPTTNNRAEWAAVIEAVSKLTAPCEVVVYSDSMNCVNAINRVEKKDAKFIGLHQDLYGEAVSLWYFRAF